MLNDIAFITVKITIKYFLSSDNCFCCMQWCDSSAEKESKTQNKQKDGFAVVVFFFLPRFLIFIDIAIQYTITVNSFGHDYRGVKNLYKMIVIKLLK